MGGAGLKAGSAVLTFIAFVFTLVAVCLNWQEIFVDIDAEIAGVPPVRVGFEFSLWGFKGKGFVRAPTVGMQYEEAQQFIAGNITELQQLTCLNSKATWGQRPCKEIGEGPEKHARRVFRLRLPGCDAYITRHKEAAEAAVFLLIPILVLQLIQLAILGTWFTKKGEGLEKSGAMFVPIILASVFYLAAILIYDNLSPFNDDVFFDDCEKNLRRSYEFDSGIIFPPEEGDVSVKPGFIMGIVGCVFTVLTVPVGYLLRRMILKNKEDKITVDEGFVSPPISCKRLSGSDAGQPGFFKDLLKIHRHAIRFVGQGQKDFETFDGEKAMFQETYGIGERYAMWRRSGLFVGFITTLILAIFLTVYLLAADIKGISDAKEDHKKVKDQVDAAIIDFDQSIDVTIRSSGALGDLAYPLVSLLMQFKSLMRSWDSLDLAKLTLKEVKVISRILQVTAVWISVPAIYLAYRWAHHMRSSMKALWLAWGLVFGLPYFLAVLPYRVGLTATPLLDDIVNTLEALLVTSVPTKAAIEQAEQALIAGGLLPFEVLSLNTQVIEGLWDTGKTVIDIIEPIEPMLLGLPFAITVLASVAPLAFSLAFSVLNGAALVKMLLPTTPWLGYVVTMLPILLTALNFTLFSALFQITPHMILTLAVLSLVIAPMWYSILGGGIRTSYTFETAKKSIKKCKKAFMASQVLGGLLLVAWVLYQAPGSPAGLLNFLNARMILTPIFNFARGFFISAIAIADLLFWMVGAVEDMNYKMRQHPEALDIMLQEQASAHAALGYKKGEEEAGLKPSSETKKVDVKSAEADTKKSSRPSSAASSKKGGDEKDKSKPAAEREEESGATEIPPLAA